MNPFKKLRVADFGDIDVNPLSIDDTFKRIAHEIQIIIDVPLGGRLNDPQTPSLYLNIKLGRNIDI
jgi:hypothetical protein